MMKRLPLPIVLGECTLGHTCTATGTILHGSPSAILPAATLVDFTTLPKLRLHPRQCLGISRPLYSFLRILNGYPPSVLTKLRKPCDAVFYSYRLPLPNDSRRGRGKPLLTTPQPQPLCHVIHSCLPVGMSLKIAGPNVLPRLFRNILITAVDNDDTGRLRNLRLSYFILDGCTAQESATMFAAAFQTALLSLPNEYAELYRTAIRVQVCVGQEVFVKVFAGSFAELCNRPVTPERHSDLPARAAGDQQDMSSKCQFGGTSSMPSVALENPF